MLIAIVNHCQPLWTIVIHCDTVYGSAGTGAGEEKLNFWEEKF